MAAAIASRGLDAIGIDINRHAVDLLQDGHAPVQETGLEETVAANRERLRATLSYREAILNSDVSFVIVPTPSDERGAFSLQYARYAFHEVGRALAEKDAYHLVVLTSTVLPGATRYGLLPVLEEASGKRCGPDFGLCYSPEFIALGSVIQNFLNPDFTLIGEFDERSGSLLEESYARIMANGAPSQRMSIENAELTKIAVNTFVTTKITFANMLAGLCERIPGGDVDVVTGALGMDSRIGRKYLTGALGYGGPCFPRDNAALSFMARALGTRAELAEATDHFNRELADGVAERLRTELPAGATVAVLGLAYKPASHVVEESQGLAIAKALGKAGMRVIAFDPLASQGARAELGAQAVVLDSVEACLWQADAVLITTPDPTFKALKASDFAREGPPVTVVDFWRLLSGELEGSKHVRYLPAGRDSDGVTNAARLEKLWRPPKGSAD